MMRALVLVPNLIAALVYGLVVIRLRFRRGPQAVGWRTAAIGTSFVWAAFFVAALNNSDGGDPGLDIYAEYFAVLFAVGAALGGLVAAFVVFRVFKAPGAWQWSVLQALLYIIEAFFMAASHG